MGKNNLLYGTGSPSFAVPHYRDDGNVKLSGEFENEIKIKLDKLYQEHESMEADAEKTVIEIGFNRLAEAYTDIKDYHIKDGIFNLGAGTAYIVIAPPLALMTPVHSMTLYIRDIRSTSPISHLEAFGKVKAMPEYKSGLEKQFNESVAEHKELIKYSLASYPELVLGNFGKVFTDIYQFHPIKAGYHLFMAAGYTVSGALNTSSHLLSTLVNTAASMVSQKANPADEHNILASPIETHIGMVEYKQQETMSNNYADAAHSFDIGSIMPSPSMLIYGAVSLAMLGMSMDMSMSKTALV